MHKQAIKHKQAIIGGGYLFTENACLCKISSASQKNTKYFILNMLFNIGVPELHHSK